MSKHRTQYSVGDLVEAKEKGKFYPAKVLRIQKHNSQAKYFIHYMKWDHKYDEWKDESNIRPIDQDSTLETNSSKISTPVPSHEADESSESDLTAQKKRKSINTSDSIQQKKPSIPKDPKDLFLENKYDNSNEDESILSFSRKVFLDLKLKKLLLDDWKLITSSNKPRLISLPRPVTIEMIVQSYLQERTKELEKGREKEREKEKEFGKGKRASKSAEEGLLESFEEEICRERQLLEGLLQFFDRALPLLLLYRRERPQYNALYSPSSNPSSSSTPPSPPPPPSSVYGLEHLLRLFVRLPRLSRDPSLPPSLLSSIQTRLAKFLKYLSSQAPSPSSPSLSHYLLPPPPLPPASLPTSQK